MDTERELLKKLSEGDISSFDALFIRFYPQVKNFILGFVKNEEDARDLSQDIFLKIWLKREKTEEIDNLRNYLFQMSKNAVFDFFRQNRSFEPYGKESTLTIKEADSVEAHVEAHDLELLLDACVELMPEQRKRVFRMSRTEGLANEEIADRLQISRRTVETHISNALKELKRLIGSILLFFI